jgi:hypothetical protein
VRKKINKNRRKTTKTFCVEDSAPPPPKHLLADHRFTIAIIAQPTSMNTNGIRIKLIVQCTNAALYATWTQS